MISFVVYHYLRIISDSVRIELYFLHFLVCVDELYWKISLHQTPILHTHHFPFLPPAFFHSLARFALLGVALSVAIFVARFNAVSVLLGFSIVVVGILGEGLYSGFSSQVSSKV